MPLRLPIVLSADDLPLAELCSARLDGELFAAGEFWCAADTAEGALLRASELALLVPPRVIAELTTAAWIYGLAPEPTRHRVCVDASARAALPFGPRFALREVTDVLPDTRLFGTQRVTEPLRTAVDLARWPDAAADIDEEALARLIAATLQHGGYAVSEPARQACAQRGRIHLARALQRLDAADAHLGDAAPGDAYLDRA